MKSKFSIRFGKNSRNEWIEYKDSDGSFTVDVRLAGDEWTIYAPGLRWEDGFGGQNTVKMTPTEMEKILPMVREFLSVIWWFWIYRKRYKVRVVSHRSYD